MPFQKVELQKWCHGGATNRAPYLPNICSHFQARGWILIKWAISTHSLFLLQPAISFSTSPIPQVQHFLKTSWLQWEKGNEKISFWKILSGSKSKYYQMLGHHWIFFFEIGRVCFSFLPILLSVLDLSFHVFLSTPLHLSCPTSYYRPLHLTSGCSPSGTFPFFLPTWKQLTQAHHFILSCL